MSRRHQPYGKEEGKSNKIKNGYGPIKEKDRGRDRIGNQYERPSRTLFISMIVDQPKKQKEKFKEEKLKEERLIFIMPYQKMKNLLMKMIKIQEHYLLVLEI